MQERVHFVPPDIKTFQGKPPPTSWVEQNVVRFHQIRSETELLKSVLAFVQQMQSEQLSKKHPTAQVKLSFAEVPEEGTPNDITNTLVFNATQPLVKAEIEHFEKLIKLLKKEDPELAKLLDPELAQLQKMGTAFPKLTDENLSKLKELIEKLNTLASKLPLTQQHKFWDKEVGMFRELISKGTEKVKDLKKGIDELLVNIQGLKETKETQGGLAQLLGSLKSKGKFTKHQVNQLISLLQNYANGYSKLTPDQQKSVNPFLKAMGSVKGSKGGSLASVASKGLLRQVLKEYLGANPNASPAQVKQFLTDYLDKSGLHTTHAPFFKEMGKEIENLVKEGRASLEVKEVHEEFVADPKTIQIQDVHEATQQQLTIQTNESENFRAGIDEGHRMLASINESLFHGGVHATANYYTTGGEGGATQTDAAVGGGVTTQTDAATGGGNLQDKFKNAIFGHFMPTERKRLMKLAAILFFSNFGAEIGNVLMDKVLDFGNASSYYNLNNLLHKNKDGKYENYSSVMNQLSKEITQAGNDLQKVESAISYINKEIKTINGKAGLTPAQKKKLIGQLKNDKGNLEQAKADLGGPKGLLNMLQDLKGNIHKGNDNTFTVSLVSVDGVPWRTALREDEGYVTNGHINAKPPAFRGGLVHIQSSIKTDQQNYSNQSQNNQMILQLQMTVMQQFFTTISTSLQTLNQSVQTFYRAIYK